MRRFLAGRLVFALALVLVAYIGVYLLTGLAPGDAAGDHLGSEATLALQRARLGLDRPLLERLASRLWHLPSLDLGTSARFGQPVLALVAQRAASTVQAGAAALLLALVLGIPAGVLAARASSAVVRHCIATLSVLLLSLPALVMALLLLLLTSGTGLPSLVLMVVALALPAAALLERLQARALHGVLRDPCLTAARARGVPAAQVTWRHAWPLSVPAVLGLAGVIAGQLLSGALAIELIAVQSGLGMLTFDALQSRDVELAAACAAAVALIVSVVSLSADALHLWLDPRVSIASDTAAAAGAAAGPPAR